MNDAAAVGIRRRARARRWIRPSGTGRGLVMLGIGVIWAGGLARLGIYDQHDRLLT
ncbi:hypothetical protein [Methylobacterium sp. Leaf93]|uniref:hypothetical protein n=1 Tax=Methylobacterium sp. Leaf93 TaxID=1736249 RepID=UPI000A642C8E|nr:hypothetical protein [Methylobacterium sp. Leaf93]